LAQIELSREVTELDFDSLFKSNDLDVVEEAQLDWDGLADLERKKDMGEQAETKSNPEVATEPPKEKDREQTRALAKPVHGPWELALEPTDAMSAYKVAGALAESRLYPKLPNKDAIFAVILRGRALGLDATTALASFHVIEGRPAMHADLISALVLRSPVCEYFECAESTDTKATYIAKRKGGRREQTETFTIEDAETAGLVVKSDAPGARDGYIGVGREGPTEKSNWSKWRRTMLRHRASTQLARRVFPDIALGLYTADEVSSGEVFEAEFEEQ
jgi:hypothetical protein